MLEEAALAEALEMLGELLAERGQRCGLLIAGGSSLLLLGLVTRPTADVDVLGIVAPHGYEKAEQLPEFLVAAVRDVGRALGLGESWVNAGPASLLDFGLPPDLEQGVTVRRFGGLEVHVPDRRDLVCFKLYAAVDQGRRSKHFRDLQGLVPTDDELRRAAAWVRTHDPSPGFHGELRRIVAALGAEADNVVA